MERNSLGYETAWRSAVPAAVAGILAWTLFCLIGWALVSLGGTLLEAVVEILFFWLPPLADALQFAVRFLASLGGGVVGVVWAIGAAIVAFGTYLLSQGDGVSFTYRETAFYGPGRTTTQSDRSPGGRPMKDVTPPRNGDDRSPSDGPYLPPR